MHKTKKKIIFSYFYGQKIQNDKTIIYNHYFIIHIKYIYINVIV